MVRVNQIKMKTKRCSFCNKETNLLYSNPKYCSDFKCRKLYNESKAKNSTNTSEKKKSPKIKPYTDKRLKELAKYRKLRDEYLKDKPFCEIQSPVCTGRTTELHHAKTRRHHLCDTSVFFASCRACNGYVESNHAWAEERGFKQRTTHGNQNKHP